ncbi:hypothetical protein FB451DRAFT_1245752 [Mycena latifolia]|nr:hypothetical protein FB451DRAFT_1245752 [Mycena latifolia]
MNRSRAPELYNACILSWNLRQGPSVPPYNPRPGHSMVCAVLPNVGVPSRGLWQSRTSNVSVFFFSGSLLGIILQRLSQKSTRFLRRLPGSYMSGTRLTWCFYLFLAAGETSDSPGFSLGIFTKWDTPNAQIYSGGMMSLHLACHSPPLSLLVQIRTTRGN